jgi:hypothetical protein
LINDDQLPKVADSHATTGFGLVLPLSCTASERYYASHDSGAVRPSDATPEGRYYELTPAGEATLIEATGEWRAIVAEVNELLEQP